MNVVYNTTIPQLLHNVVVTLCVSWEDVTSLEGRALLNEFKKLVVRRGVLYRQIQTEEGNVFQLVLPVKYRELALRGAHNDNFERKMLLP